MAPLRAVLVGADSLLIECGEILLAKGHEVTAVVAGSDRVASWAGSHRIPVVEGRRPSTAWGPDLSQFAFDWLLSVTHLELIDDAALALPQAGAINFHDGPLPRYAGLNTPSWALMRGERSHGVSWHAITSDVDAGDVYKQRTFDLADDETGLSLNMRNFEAAIASFGELVDELAEGTVRPTPQDPAAERLTFRRSDRPAAMGVLDWTAPAEELERLVRATNVGPYPNTIGVAKVLDGDRVVHVTTAAVADDPGAVAPGTVLDVSAEALVVACEPGAVALTGFTTQTGAPLGVEEAATVLDARPGRRLPVLDAATRDTLSEVGRRLALGERRHLARLEALHPVELPWAATPAAGHEHRYRSLPVAVPDGADAAAVVAAFGALLGRLAGVERFHLALVDPALAVPEPAAPMVAPAVALELAVEARSAMASVRDAVADELAGAGANPPFARELIARTPDLARRPELARGLLPIAVRLGGAGMPEPGTVVELQEASGAWHVAVDEGLVAPTDAELLVSCLDAALADAADDPATTVGDLDLLGPGLRATVLERWNDTTVEGATDATIPQLFEAQVDRSPDTVAAVFEDRPITYRELDERANRLAHLLRDLGVGADALVGVHVERGLDLLVATLGVQKAGGAYVPLDPAYPRERLEHMIRDSRCAVVITDAEAGVPPLPEASTARVVDLDADAVLAEHPATRPGVAVRPSDLAYCIYTSGSTGLPKGVLVEHRNAVNFFAGMDPCVAPELPATWFAVTSLSFDISVLELLYTLTRGFTVVVHRDRDRTTDGEAADAGAGSFREQHGNVAMDFSLFYFSGDESEHAGSDKYRLLLEGARWADEHGFCAVWTPERHFHAFGGLYPNPAVTGAAVAAVTKNLAIRAGSVVMPLNHPIRVAEAWSIVDNLSNGRVAVSVASGWQPNDFVLMPENFANAKQAMFDGVEVVKRLWRGEAVTFTGPTGDFEVTTLPRPVQAELPIWVTTAGNPETYVAAGRMGANVLTHLLGQSVEQLAPKIAAYREARAEAGFDPDAGVVSLMLHTFVGDDDDAVRAVVREPLKQYLGTSFSLLKEYAWAFPVFQRPGEPAVTGVDSLADDDFKNLSEEDLDAVLEFAFLRYFESSGLFGTPETCLPMVDRLKGIGVDEIACLVDFGVATDTVLESLPQLDAVRRRANAGVTADLDVIAGSAEGTGLDQSVAAQLRRHRVTHLQCTPSMARMLTMQEDSRAALGEVDHLFIGGEAFPVALARDLAALADTGTVTNMYGPTETTIWSTTWPLGGDLATVPIGTPIANTSVYVLDANLQPLPPGVQGELWIGGAGVVRGYHERPELTAERFVPDPFRGGDARMYRTGDLARWRRQPDGSGILEFLGRIDHQVKIRGYRIELGEIEAQLGRDPAVLECVAVVQEETPGDQQLVAYVSPRAGASVEPAAVRAGLRQHLPEVMVPAHVVVLDHLPHTPNGKIDRNALPSLAEVRARRAASAAPAAAGSDLERQVLAIWEDTLQTAGIGIDDNFFDIGGHSLLLVGVQRRLREELDRSIPLTDLYRFPTVRSFAASLSSDASEAVMQTSMDRAARRREAMQRRRTRA
jgi:natural product biosynthesis luciferase-like monooxygenase protein